MAFNCKSSVWFKKIFLPNQLLCLVTLHIDLIKILYSFQVYLVTRIHLFHELYNYKDENLWKKTHCERVTQGSHYSDVSRPQTMHLNEQDVYYKSFIRKHI